MPPATAQSPVRFPSIGQWQSGSASQQLPDSHSAQCSIERQCSQAKSIGASAPGKPSRLKSTLAGGCPARSSRTNRPARRVRTIRRGKAQGRSREFAQLWISFVVSLRSQIFTAFFLPAPSEVSVEKSPPADCEFRHAETGVFEDQRAAPLPNPGLLARFLVNPS